MSNITPRPYQAETLTAIIDSHKRNINRQLSVLFTGAGKCLAKNTPVMMYDGTIKLVQDIVTGEQLMGPDSTPRNVLSTCIGKEQMYRIVPTKGESWECNESHILSLVYNGPNLSNKKKGDIIDISVKEWLQKSTAWQSHHKLFRVGVDFDKKELSIEPYLLGLWLGDGDSRNPIITNTDEEIIKYLKNKFDDLYDAEKRDGHANRWVFTKEGIKEKLRQYNLIQNKHIPHQYKTSSAEQRLELLAGILDTDGHLTNSGYDIILKQEQFADDLLYLVRSLGLACYKSVKNVDGYYRLHISGDCSVIPCKVKRKKAEPRKQIKNVLRVGFKVEKLTVDNYYGFTIDGDRRFLLGDFTVTHNTILAIMLLKKYVAQGKRILILVDQEDLVWQWKSRAHEVDPNLTIGIEKAEYKSNKFSQIVVASVQTLGRKGNKRIKKFPPDQFDLCLVDEAHKSISESWFRVLNYFGFGNENFTKGNLLVGLTATPFRTSGESLGILYDDIVANYDIRYGISEGWLTDIVVHDVKTTTDISHVQSYKDDFNMKQLTEAVNTQTRNEEIVKAYKQICDGEQSIVYCASVQHAYDMEQLFEAYGISAKTIEANTDKADRKKWMAEFREGKIDVLTNYGTLSTGIDFPELRTILLARPIKSKLLFTQILGRVLRPSQTAFVDAMPDAECRNIAIDTSDKPVAKVIDFHDTTGSHNVAHIPSLFGLHNELQTKSPKKIFKEVVEPLEDISKEKGIDITKIKSLDEIDLIVKNRKYDVKSLKLSPEVQQFTDRSWVDIGNDSYEIIYSKQHKALVIECDISKKELVGKHEWRLLEIDTKAGITKKLQTFNSLAGAFKTADKYADHNKWSSKYLKKEEWMSRGVTFKQFKLLEKMYKYKNGYSEYRLLEERYSDTQIRKIFWKKTQEILDSGTASKLIDKKMNK